MNFVHLREDYVVFEANGGAHWDDVIEEICELSSSLKVPLIVKFNDRMFCLDLKELVRKEAIRFQNQRYIETS